MAKEIYRALVSRINDEKKLGRIKVTCQGLAAYGKELPWWVEPIFPIAADGWGWFHVPEVGDEVEIEITIHDDSDETHGESSISNPNVRYRAGAYSAGQKVPDELKKNYGKRMGMRTPKGSFLFFDDTDGSEEIHVTSKGKVNVEAAKEVNITAGAGSTVNLNGSDQPIATKADFDALKATITSAGVAVQDGGATFKAAILSGWPASIGSTKVKAGT